MKIYFSANHRYLERDLALYREIIGVIQREGHVLVNNWVETANNRWPQEMQYYDWASVCIAARGGIDDADVLLAEASGETGFGVGFETAYALSKGKKIGILIRKTEMDNSYTSGLDRKEIYVCGYERTVLADVLRETLVLLETRL